MGPAVTPSGAQGRRGALPVLDIWSGGCLRREGSSETCLTTAQHPHRSDEASSIFIHHVHPTVLAARERGNLCPAVLARERFKVIKVKTVSVKLVCKHTTKNSGTFFPRLLLMYFWDTPSINILSCPQQSLSNQILSKQLCI